MMLANQEYLQRLRKRQASTSIGASTARRMGPTGTIDAARAFLAEVPLDRFRTRTKAKFQEALEATTIELMAALPDSAQNWGSARKFLNIFLRGCAYNKYLCEHHNLGPIEPWLEVPLDSHVVKKLKAHAGRGKLPRWNGVIHLTPEESRLFQAHAAQVALSERVHPVDLDVKYWRSDD